MSSHLPSCEYSTTVFPIQAPLPVSQNAHALAFLQFLRSFAGVSCHSSRLRTGTDIPRLCRYGA